MVKLRRTSGIDQVIELPHARLLPDLRHTPVDAGRLRALLTANGDDGRIARVFDSHATLGGSLCQLLLEQAGMDDRTLAYTVARPERVKLFETGCSGFSVLRGPPRWVG